MSGDARLQNTENTGMCHHIQLQKQLKLEGVDHRQIGIQSGKIKIISSIEIEGLKSKALAM